MAIQHFRMSLDKEMQIRVNGYDLLYYYCDHDQTVEVRIMCIICEHPQI